MNLRKSVGTFSITEALIFPCLVLSKGLVFQKMYLVRKLSVPLAEGILGMNGSGGRKKIYEE